MKNAYKHADGRKVDNRRVVVDVERGRTVPDWRPRRLGGGLGSGRFSGEGADNKRPAREQHLAGRPRSEGPRTRRNDRHADRDQVRGRDQDERASARSYERSRDLESRGGRQSLRGHDRTREKDQVRDRKRDREHGYDCDRRDKYKSRYHGRDYDREREIERPHDRHRDREHAGHQRDRSQLYECYEEDTHGKSIEPEAAEEEGERYMEGNYQFDQADN